MNLIKYYIKKHVKRFGPADPYIPANDRLQCIFTHIPKCAGISIDESLFGEKIGHKNYIDFKVYDARRCRRYFKFTVVREPIDRFISAFRFLKSGGRNSVDRDWSNRLLSKFNTPEELAVVMQSDVALSTQVFSMQHFRPQYTFLVNERAQIEMDYILSFSSLADGFKEITEVLGVAAELKHANKTSSSTAPTGELSRESRVFLMKEYQEDYKRLGQYFE